MCSSRTDRGAVPLSSGTEPGDSAAAPRTSAARTPAGRRRNRLLRSIPALASGGLFLLAAAAGDPLFAPSILPRVGEEAIRTVRAEEYRKEQAKRFAEEAEQSAVAPTRPADPAGAEEREAPARPLAGLQDADVHLFFVESYGYTILSDPENLAHIRDAYRDLGNRLTGAGFRIASSLMDSPAFGGNSWLADATFTTGVRIDDQTQYDLLLQSDVRPMASRFAEAGYRTVNVMPATGGAWPEGAFFGFERSYHWKDFGYRGPSFRWAPMPDQFALDVIRRKELAKRERPLFVQYILVSSHYPFQIIPRYLPDWDGLGDGSLFARTENSLRLPIPPGSKTDRRHPGLHPRDPLRPGSDHRIRDPVPAGECPAHRDAATISPTAESAGRASPDR